MPGSASFAAATSILASCFVPWGTMAPKSTPGLATRFSSGRSVTDRTLPLIPGESNRTFAPVRLRPSTVKVAVAPRSRPFGQTLLIVGGMVGCCAFSGSDRATTLTIPRTRTIIVGFMINSGDGSLFEGRCQILNSVEYLSASPAAFEELAAPDNERPTDHTVPQGEWNASGTSFRTHVFQF